MTDKKKLLQDKLVLVNALVLKNVASLKKVSSNNLDFFLNLKLLERVVSLQCVHYKKLFSKKEFLSVETIVKVIGQVK